MKLSFDRLGQHGNNLSVVEIKPVRENE